MIDSNNEEFTMKKLFFTLIAVLVLGGCKNSNVKPLNNQVPDAQMTETKQADVTVFQRNPLYVNFRYEFEKLNDDEILTYRKEGRVINVKFLMADEEEGIIENISDSENDLYIFYARNIKTEEERQIGGAWKSFWGGYQFSIDRKIGIFHLLITNTRTGRFPLLKIDGRLGTITYLMDINASARSTKNFEYMLCNVHGEKINGVSKENKLALINLEKIEVVKLLHWNITPLLGCGNIILRSLDDNYDFKIVYTGEGDYAIAYYNIEKDILDTVFDITEYKESAWKYAKEYYKYSNMEWGDAP